MLNYPGFNMTDKYYYYSVSPYTQPDVGLLPKVMTLPSAGSFA